MRWAPTNAALPDPDRNPALYSQIMTIDVTVLRVFTDSDGNFGNALGVVDAKSAPADQRQAIARELGYSETIFIEETDRLFATPANAANYDVVFVMV